MATYATFSGWKRAVKAAYPTAKFWGDMDCRAAQVGAVIVAEWLKPAGWVME
jgi:hypothetical protein